MKPRVLVSIPIDPGNPNVHVDILGVCLKYLHNDPRCSELAIVTPAYKPYVNNLHRIVKSLLDGNWDYWINIDSDNPPLENPIDLIFLDKDVIGLPTPTFKFSGKIGERNICYSAYDYDEKVGKYRDHNVYEGLQRVDAVGTGCFVMNVDVLKNPDMRAPFTREYNDDGIMVRGNDIRFSERATACGYELWTHYHYLCEHYGTYGLNKMVKSFKYAEMKPNG